MAERKFKTRTLLICLLAFAIATYFIIRQQRIEVAGEGEGLRNFSVVTFEDSTGWAYRIYEDKVALIEQKTIPGVPGVTGFKTREDAEKTGKLVIDKLNHQIFPPTVSREELDSMKVGY